MDGVLEEQGSCNSYCKFAHTSHLRTTPHTYCTYLAVTSFTEENSFA